MKKFSKQLILLLSLVWASSIWAQPAGLLEPVKWEFEAGDKIGDRYELRFKATIDDGWHLYSHFISDEGPIPTSIIFEENDDIDVKEKFKENGNKITKHDEAFDMELSWYEHEVTFVQRAKLNKGVDGAVLKGEVEFMVCNDKMCLPPDYIPFSFALGEVAESEIAAAETDIDISGGYGNDDMIIKEPTHWFYRVSEEGENLKVEWKVNLDKGWQIYSQHIEEGGPYPTEFLFDGKNNVTLVGNMKEEGELLKKNEPLFDNMELLSYKDQVVYSQIVKWIDDRDPILSGTADYMVCEEACIPGGLEFKINLKEKRGEWVSFDEEIGSVPDPSTADVDGLPGIMEASIIDKANIDKSCSDQPEKKKSFWLIFVLGFGGGLIALLTPCVFPMIPLTVSFFTKGDEKASKDGVRNALIYGLSIIVIYVVMTMSVILTLGPFMLNWISTGAIFNIIFFLIFVIFAFSFFGFYEITLPSSWANKTDKLSSKGGLVGIFFMAFTLAIVSFSCTGPIIGSLILGVVQEGIMGPLFGMLGFSIALALPFTLFAIFPKWLNSLPQSGGWLNSVKVFLGFVELAFALKFFSVADLTKHFGILKYELFIGLWVIIFILLALYMFGIIKFPHDTKNAKSGTIKRLVGVASLVFSIYLAYGMVNYKPLLGGIAPAPGYSFLRPSECPQGVNVCFHDYEEGMAYAKSNKQPVLLDFTGYGCVNCRLMENNVWSKKEVNAILNKYVVISLYVDDRTVLPESEHYVSEYNGRTRKIDKVGKFWVDFQTRHFNQLSQPYYVLMSPNGEVLNKPVGYTPNKEKYIEFLECGLNNLKEVCPDCN